jgi:hypothetical protein
LLTSYARSPRRSACGACAEHRQLDVFLDRREVPEPLLHAIGVFGSYVRL